MPGLPKIALARLKANPDASKPSGGTMGPSEFQGSQHPDANLLAAFVEKTLTEKERAQVLNHLSQCADCREVAALSMPPEAPLPQPIRMPAGRRWNPWPVLRWGAMAAVLGVLTLVVLLHPNMYKHREIARVTTAPAPAGNVASTPQHAAPLPPAPSPAPSVETKTSAEARESAGSLMSMAKASGPQRDLSLQDKEEIAEAKKQVTTLDSIRPPATVNAENIPKEKAERYESRGGNALAAGALSTTPPPSAPAGQPVAASGDAGKTNADALGGLPTSQVTTLSRTSAEEATGAIPAAPPPAKPAPQAIAHQTMGMMAQSRVAEMGGLRKDKALRTTSTAALWTVSSDGQVQRSTEAGKTTELVQVAHGVRFITVAALGNEVWAGGTNGALYHSVDGGATWNRVSINVDGIIITESLAVIQLAAPQRVIVTTASGSQWASDDDGVHWQKKP
jgi:hypothetical protein